MKASVGDRIVIASNRLDRAVRDGKIVECRNEDGSPPDAHVQHFADEDTRPRGGGDQPSGEVQQPKRHVKTWRVEVSPVRIP